MSEQSNHKTAPEGGPPGFWPGVFAGVALGAAVGLLLAPRPGNQTLSFLLDRSGEFSDRLAELVEDARDLARVIALKAQGFPGSDPYGGQGPGD